MSELVKLRWGAAIGALVIVVGAVGWNWPQEPPMSTEDEDAFEREYGVPVNAHGSVVVARWGTGLTILFVVIAFGALLLSYFYLRLENPVWPPAGDPVPALTGMLLPAALIALSVVAVQLSKRRIHVDDRRGFVALLAGAVVLCAAAAALQWADIAALGLDGPSHAYDSIFLTLAGFVSVVAGGAAVMLVMAIFWALKGFYSAARHAPVVNVARFWLAMALVWVVGFGTLYLGPQLT